MPRPGRGGNAPRLPRGSGPALRKGWDPTLGGPPALSEQVRAGVYGEGLATDSPPRPPESLLQETLLGELRVLEDVEARRLARPLPRRDWWEVITEESEHPTTILICDNCGEVTEALLYCGVILCVPCWRRKALRDGKELLLTLQAYIKTRPSFLPFYPRFVTLTIRSGPDLEERVRVLLDAWARLRHRTWWARKTLGAVLKVEVTWSPAQGWHPHLQIIQVGFYLPQDELSEKWAEATRGEGYIVDVRARPVPPGSSSFLGLVKELAKYVAKPTAPTEEGKSLPLQAWPQSIRGELAALLAGGTRVRWWCPTHRSASWERCQTDVLPGMVKFDCGGGLIKGRRVPPASYRIELTGFRRLRWYGALREAHRHTGAFARTLEARCRKCGKGVLRSLRTFEAWARDDPSWLQFIRGHKSTDGDSAPEPPRWNRWLPDPLQATLHLWSSDRPPPGGRP